MLDISKLLGGLLGEEENPLPKLPVMNPSETPGITPLPIGQTPGINPNGIELNPIKETSDTAPAVGPIKAPVNWKERLLGGLQGLQAGTQAQPQFQAQPMDTSDIKNLQFAHQRNGGIIPRGRY